MRFGGALLHLLECILKAYMTLGTYFLSKVDLTGAYVRMWVRLVDIPYVAFLVPKDTD